MKLYVNGDSHSAGAESVNPHSFAEDDSQYFYLGRAPHPENAKAAWPMVLARTLKAVLHNDSESASSNQRILRTTKSWIERHTSGLPETIILIQWSTWEREEWLIDGQYYQINASGQDTVPLSHQEAYKNYIIKIDWEQQTRYWHQEIWRFHLDLKSLGIAHVFMNGNTHFGKIAVPDRLDWGYHYIAPYDPAFTYDAWLKRHSFLPVSPNSWHFGREAHAAWSRFVLQYCVQNNILP